MGLDTSHDCWHGPYSWFARWRLSLAKTLAMPTLTDERFGVERYELPDGEWQARNYMGWWDENPENILTVLFVHSDCDGYIFPQHAEPLADALEKIRTNDEDMDYLTDQFVAGLRKAADNWEIVEFH